MYSNNVGFLPTYSLALCAACTRCSRANDCVAILSIKKKIYTFTASANCGPFRKEIAAYDHKKLSLRLQRAETSEQWSVEKVAFCGWRVVVIKSLMKKKLGNEIIFSFCVQIACINNES